MSLVQVVDGKVRVGNKNFRLEDGKLISELTPKIGNTLTPFKLNTEEVTSERWVDDRPIYRNMLDITIDGDSTSTPIPGFEIGNEAWVEKFLAKDATGATYSAASGIVVKVLDGNIIIEKPTELAIDSAKVVVHYTKVSDNQSSPVRLIGSDNRVATDIEYGSIKVALSGTTLIITA